MKKMLKLTLAMSLVGTSVLHFPVNAFASDHALTQEATASAGKVVVQSFSANPIYIGSSNNTGVQIPFNVQYAENSKEGANLSEVPLVIKFGGRTASPALDQQTGTYTYNAADVLNLRWTEDNKLEIKGNNKTGQVTGSYTMQVQVPNKYMVNGQASTVTIALSFDSPVTTGKLWDNPVGPNFYRIPAITTTNEGDLLAVTDLRYKKAADLGDHQIDLLYRTSPDNGSSWSSDTNITKGHSSEKVGYGDTAIVADRDSDKVLILAAFGSAGYFNTTRQNPVRVSKMVSNDGGKSFSKPEDITDQIYSLDQTWKGLFATSGRIMQSRYVKVGEHYRIYTAILGRSEGEAATKNNKNWVLYSDDFGDTWHLLGGAESPVTHADEAKIEELPNGNVVITSRAGQARRLVNIFTYDENDPTYSKGKWEDAAKYLKFSAKGNATNGELLLVYAKEKATGKYTHLLMQSLPTLDDKVRKGVRIYYKAVDTSLSTVDQFLNGWSEANSYMVQRGSSAYSTMTIQDDGAIGFLYEDTNSGGGFDIVYKSLDLETITNNKYENAFTGIGSVETPYVIETEAQLEAKETVYANEGVHWHSAIPAPTGITVTDVTYNSASIAWKSVGEGYEYSIRLNDQNVGNTQETAWSFTKLQENSVNTIEISAKKDGRVSLYSEPLVVSTIPVMPSAEEVNLRFQDVTANSATVLWNTVSGATYYDLSLNNGQTYTSLTNTIYLTGLTENTEYTATLTAGNSSGKSSSGLSGSFTTGRLAPTLPVGSQDSPVVSTPVVSTTPEPDPDEKADDQVIDGADEGVKEITNSFKDIDNVWNKDQIVELYQKGIIKGYSADHFGANNPVTRIEFAVMLVRAMGYETDKGYTGTYTDLNPNAWYMAEIASILENGIAQGNGNNEFQPGVEISREQAAKMLYAIMEKEGLIVDISKETEFKDNGDIAAWAKDAVYVAKANGIINGLPDGNFEPSRELTRAEAVSLIYNLLKVVR